MHRGMGALNAKNGMIAERGVEANELSEHLLWIHQRDDLFF
jgi:hypothetical protein